jgi:hypothetical protein
MNWAHHNCDGCAVLWGREDLNLCALRRDRKAHRLVRQRGLRPQFLPAECEL